MFRYLGQDQLLKEAVLLANYKNIFEHILKRVEFQEQYDMANVPNSKYLAIKLIEFHHMNTLDIQVYYPRWRWSKAIGYFDKNKPNYIFVNGYRYPKISVKNLVSLFYHEMAHAMDALDEKYSYGHGSNWAKGKERTFPYSLNRFVEDYFAPKEDRFPIFIK
jgi:hypothetical protein